MSSPSTADPVQPPVEEKHQEPTQRTTKTEKNIIATNNNNNGGESQQQLTDEEKKELRAKKEAEELLLQQQRIQMMQMRIASMNDTNSVERRRAEILRNVKLSERGGAGVDRSYSIQGEFLFESDKTHPRSQNAVDRLDEKMKKVVASSPERLLKRKMAIMSPTSNDSGDEDVRAAAAGTGTSPSEVTMQQQQQQRNSPSASSSSQQQRQQSRSPVNNAAAATESNNDISREIESMGQNIANLVAQLNNNSNSGNNNNSASRTVSAVSQQNHYQEKSTSTPQQYHNTSYASPSADRHHYHNDPMMMSSPSSYNNNHYNNNSNNYSYYTSPYNQNNNNNHYTSNQQEEADDSRLEYMNIGDDPQDPLRSSPARNAVELLRKDAMSDGGIMLPYNKLRLRSLARRSSPVLSRVPPYRQNDSAIANANAEEQKRRQKITDDNIKKSGIVDVATAALKRKEKEFVDAAKLKKQEVRQQGHKSYTEELAERAFRRKHGIAFDEVAPLTPRAGQTITRTKTPLSTATARTTTPRSSTHKHQHTSRNRVGGGGGGRSLLYDDPEDDVEQRSTTSSVLNNSNTTTRTTTNPDDARTGTNNTETRGFSDVQATAQGDASKIARAASTILLCAQVIRGFVAPTIAAVTGGGGHSPSANNNNQRGTTSSILQLQQQQQRSESGVSTTSTREGSPSMGGGGAATTTTNGTTTALQLAEQSVLQGVEAAAIAVDNLLRDPSYQLESLHSVETMLENALKLHNSLNAASFHQSVGGGSASRGVSEIDGQQQQQQHASSGSQLPYPANFVNATNSINNSPHRAIQSQQQSNHHQNEY